MKKNHTILALTALASAFAFSDKWAIGAPTLRGWKCAKLPLSKKQKTRRKCAKIARKARKTNRL